MIHSEISIDCDFCFKAGFLCGMFLIVSAGLFILFGERILKFLKEMIRERD